MSFHLSLSLTDDSRSGREIMRWAPDAATALIQDVDLNPRRANALTQQQMFILLFDGRGVKSPARGVLQHVLIPSSQNVRLLV